MSVLVCRFRYLNILYLKISAREDKYMHIVSTFILSRSTVSCNCLESPKLGEMHDPLRFAAVRVVSDFFVCHVSTRGGPQSCIAPGFEFLSFQFFEKCPHIDTTLTSLAWWGKLKWNFSMECTSRSIPVYNTVLVYI